MPMIDIEHLQYVSHAIISRRFIFCAILFTAIVPFICINLIGYHLHDSDGPSIVPNSLKIKQRFLQHIQTSYYSETAEVNDGIGIDFNEELEDYFIAQEKELAANVTAVISSYEKECSQRLQYPSHKVSETKLAANQYNRLRKIPQWQDRLVKCKDIEKRKFFLTSALQVRVYKTDKAKWTIKELKQWLHYMFWAGIEHVYVCDHYLFQSERLFEPLKKYIEAKLITYMVWNHTRIAMTAQVTCYQHIIEKFGSDSVWQIAVDMDEYPFMPNDTQENFLSRYLKSLRLSVTEVSLHNFLMLGNGNRSRTMTIERITRMTPKPANNLDKPLYRPTRVIAGIHHNQIKQGRLIEGLDDEIRLLHFWGSRQNNFGPDTPELFAKTIEYTTLRDSLSSAIRESLISFGELDAFCNSTGP